MDIIRTSLLSAGQADEIKELLNGCRDSKGQTPFFPFEDGDLFYLLFTETDDNAASISPYFLTNYPRILRRWISTFL